MAMESPVSKNVVAVLTGDIVKSSSLTSNRRYILFQSLQVLSKLIRNQYPDDVLFDLSKFRGDGWQLLISNPQKSFEISLYIRTFIRHKFKPEKLDSRIAIAIGNVEFIPKDNVSEGFGKAFTESGRVLDSLKNQYLGFILTDYENAIENRLVNALLKSYDAFITSWTAAQSQAVFLTLQGLTQNDVGKRWEPNPIAQATVANHLKSANWDLINEGIKTFNEVITCFISEKDGG